MAAVAARGGRRNLPAVIVFHTDHGTSFFSGFKREVIDGEHFATRADARAEIFTWLN